MRFLSDNFSNNTLVVLKDDLWLKRQKYAGRCVASILKACGNAIKEKTPNLSLLDLENISKTYFKSLGCEATFYNYKGFPGHACISVNKELVHGIPSDYVLQNGDVVSVDLGATYEGAIADAARTWIYGDPKSEEHIRMISSCWKSLQEATKALEIGKQLGVIGNTISKRAQNDGFGLVTNYGGHYISYNKPHADPFVANKSSQFEGIRIVPGSSMAIEPMFVLGDPKTKVLNDGWTVVTNNIGCHFENSVTVMEDGNHIITEIPHETY